MSETSLMMGDTDIGGYVSDQPSPSQDRLAYIDRVLIDYPSQAEVLNIELAPWQALRAEKEGYQNIDPSFLTMSGIIQRNGKDVRVPRFGVFKRSADGFSDLSLKYTIGPNGGSYPDVVYIESADGNAPIYNHEVLVRPLAMSTEIGKSSQGIIDVSKHYRHNNPTGETMITFTNPTCRLDFKLSERTKFAGFIPKDAKRKLQTADEIYGSEVYLIAEMKPEDWTNVRIQPDPLLLGVSDDGNVKLVHHFNTTPLEEQVRREFSS